MSLTPEQLQMVIDRLPAANSLRQLARELGLPQKTVSAAAGPFITLLRATGTLGDCDCGQPRFHPYGCTSTRAGYDDMTSPGGLVDRRNMIIGLMLDGIPIKQIARMLGINPSSVRGRKRFMTPEQLERLAVISARNIQEGRKMAGGWYGKRPAPKPSDPRLVKALIEGRSYLDITEEFGFVSNTIARAVRRLTPEQMARREAAMSAKRVRTATGWSPRREPGTGRFEQKAPVEPQPSEWRIAA